MQDTIVPLVEDRLYLLPNPYELKGRVGTHPPEARGYASQNCYLFVEGKAAVLVDTGFSVHEQSLIRRLEKLIQPGMTLELCVLRLGEYYGICNVRPLVERFGVKRFYSTREDGKACCDFRPEYVPYGTEIATGRFADVENIMLKGTGEVDLGGGRVLRLTRAPLRLLPTNWMYDKATRTLLTADIFAYMWQPGPEGPWVVDPSEPTPGDRHVRDFMAGTRYWWLPGARTRKIRAGLDKLFSEYAVERICPGYGRVLEGVEVVKNHLATLGRVLDRFPHEPATGVDACYTDRSVRAPAAAGAQ